MARRTTAEVYRALRRAGFTAQQATTMTAIAGGESGYDDTALGDLSLQDAKWGPSYGLFQIRTLKAATGTGQARDISWLSGSIENQAKAAYLISQRGADFSPWTVYVTGKFRDFLGGAVDAARSVGERIGEAIGGGVGALVPDQLDPRALVDRALTGLRDLSLTAVFVVLGIGLVGFGLIRATGPARRRADAAARKVVLGS